MGADRDDVKLWVAGEVHEVEVVGGTISGLWFERAWWWACRRGGAKVGPGEELEENVTAKDVGKGGQGKVVAGKVVISGEASIGDNENGEGGAVWEIHGEGCDGGREGGE